VFPGSRGHGFEPPVIASYVQMSVLVLAGACVQGIGGIGFAMFCAPIAGLFFPSLVPGPLLLLGAVASLLAAVRERTHIRWTIAGVAMSGRVVGSALAVALVAMAPARYFSVAFGLMLLGAVVLTLTGWKVQPSTRNTCVAGVISGLMGTITSTGAPPLAILTQRLEPPQIRATVGSILAAGAAVSLAMLAAAGKYSAEQLLLSVTLLPWVFVGFALSGRVGRRISARNVRMFLLALCAFGAIAILVKAAV
jgi:uncharacterized protein